MGVMMRKFLREFRSDMAAVLAAVLGIFFLTDQFELRETISKGLRALSGNIGVWLMNGLNRLLSYLGGITIFDLLGWLLIVGSVGFLIWRIRTRFSSASRWRSKICPRCGSSLMRMHRTQFDRLLSKSLFPSARRYQCINPSCSWNGLRHHETRGSKRPVDIAEPPG